MIDLEQLKKCNDEEWHRVYGGQITLNCEDVDILLRAFNLACEKLANDSFYNTEEMQEILLKKVEEDEQNN